MNRTLLKLSLACFAGTLFLTAAPKTAMAAYEEAVAGYMYDKDSISSNLVSDSSAAIATTMSLTLDDIPIPGFNDIAIANVDTNLCIRSGAGEDYKIIGKLPKNGGCEVLSTTDNGWTEITTSTASGALKGFVKSEYLITGAAATALAKEVGFYVATANTDGLNVRSEASTDSSKIDIIAKGEELLVLDSKVVTDNDEYKVWVKVSLDSDTEEGSVGYVVRDFVDLSYELVHGLSIQEIQYGSGVSQTRVDIVNKAKEYLGGRYVWGGTSLNNGVDCSGFTRAIYAKFGYFINRTSREQARGGSSISASDLKPGDLVFYGSSSYINHVAMYIGGGQVIHASNARDGIKISNMYYRTPVKYVRYLGN